MNEFVLKNKNKDKDKDKQVKSRVFCGFYWNLPEDEELKKKTEDLQAKDRISFTEFIRTCIREYVKRHHPGNAQLPLAPWQTGEAFSESAQEALKHSLPKPVCPEGERNGCPQYIDLCVHRKRFACKFDGGMRR